MLKILPWAIGAIVIIVIGFFLRGPIIPIYLKAEPIIPPVGFESTAIQTPIGPLILTNTITAAWVTIAVLMLITWLVTGFTGNKLKMIPSGLQNVFEYGMEVFLNLCESIAGRENGRRFFPLIFSIFLFIMISGWLALVPGFLTIGYAHASKDGHGAVMTRVGPAELILPGAQFISKEEAAAKALAAGGKVEKSPDGPLIGEVVPIFRATNTDLNTPLALAVIAVVVIQFWGFRTLGVAGYGGKFIAVGTLFQGNILNGIIDIFIGLIEIVSEFSRIISFTFRLFGNMFAGEVLLIVITFLLPFLVPMPFYGLEAFVAFVQGLVFAMLTLVFAASAVTSHHGGHDEGHGPTTEPLDTVAATQHASLAHH